MPFTACRTEQAQEVASLCNSLPPMPLGKHALSCVESASVHLLPDPTPRLTRVCPCPSFLTIVPSSRLGAPSTRVSLAPRCGPVQSVLLLPRAATRRHLASPLTCGASHVPRSPSSLRASSGRPPSRALAVGGTARPRLSPPAWCGVEATRPLSVGSRAGTLLSFKWQPSLPGGVTLGSGTAVLVHAASRVTDMAVTSCLLLSALRA